MLRELQNVRQIPGEGHRRWFSSAYFDLMVWYGDDCSFVGFQLCYDKPGVERALTWLRGQVSHLGVDNGELPERRHKGTPVLVADGKFDAQAVLPRFMREAVQLPADVVQAVLGPMRGEGAAFVPLPPG